MSLVNSHTPRWASVGALLIAMVATGGIIYCLTQSWRTGAAARAAA